MLRKLSEERRRMLRKIVKRLDKRSRFAQCAGFTQHRTTTTRAHCVAVAYTSCRIAEVLGISVDWDSLIRGALLHDYYLYDWHISKGRQRWHGFRHPGIALRHAESELSLSRRERNMILRHMFPLTPVPPTCREAWIVCLADKICALREIAFGPAPILAGEN